MSIDSLMEFWSMQGYGLYVWPCIAMTGIVLAVEIIWLQKRTRRHFKKMSKSEFNHDPAS